MSNENRLARVTKPMTDLVILNAETTGAVLQRQNAFVAEVIAASVDQVRVLTTVGSLRDAVESQRTYIREIGEKFQSTARANIETIRDAGRGAGEVVRGAFRNAKDDVEETMDEIRSDVAEGVENVASNVSDSIAPAADQPVQPQY